MLPRHRNKVAAAQEFEGYMKQDLRMPQYVPARVEKPDKVDDLYPMKWPVYNNSDVEHRVDQVVGSVSLFAPYPHEEDSDEPQILLERPVTPINEEIKAPPLSFNQLVKYVRRRIAAKRDTPHLSVDDQQNLAGVLMGEVNGIWREVKKQVDDPFLTPKENRELNRRISVYIVTVCERLFKHYLKKAQVLNSRGVFSGPANMCRLKAQLALDANRLLNILTVRRYIVSDMRGRTEGDEEAESLNIGGLNTQVNPLSFKSLMQSIRPKSGVDRPRMKTAMEELQEITDTMPELDTGKLLTLLEYLPDRTVAVSSGDAYSSHPSRVSRQDSNLSAEMEEKSRRLVMEKRSRSLPTLKGQGESLQEELGLEGEQLKPDPTYEITELLTGTKNEEIDEDAETPSPEKEKKDSGATDLQQLIARSKEIDEDEFHAADEEEMPSLLQALTRGRKHDGLKKKLEKQLQQLEEKQRLDEEKNIMTVQEPRHPQPATVNSKLPNKMVVRTSDIRVSERVCMSSLTLHRFATVYNDLLDEVDATMVKHLDKNLFLKDEIKEVYKEIMKSAPTDHLDMDNDELVMPTADQVDLSSVMPSSTLNKKRNKRVINPQLERPLDAPWGDRDVKDWVKTPNSPPKNFRGESQFPPFTPNMEKINEIMDAKSTGFRNVENIPPAVAEKMARTYASWLQWWKSNVSTDDYMKYVSTQDTDFLAVLYHFYDSEDVGVEEEELPPPIPHYSHLLGGSQKPPSRGATSMSTGGQQTVEQLSREKDEKKLAELKAQKTEFKEGFWNVNSVMLGGLGREPALEVEEPPTLPATPESEEGLKAAKTLMGRALARRSAKSSRSQRDEEDPRSSTVMSRYTTTALSIPETVKSSTKGGPEEVKQLTPQERLEKVWSALHMPDGLKLDMAIKYSCNEFYDKLLPAIGKWEILTDLILKREAILSKLEKFERLASDPNRFFVKGHKGSSAARLDEARQRSAYYRRIEDLEDDIKTDLEYIKNNFNDHITYKGRPYEDTMKWDRIEMLYWLQEERKQNAIRYESIIRQIPLKTAHLEPIRSSSS